MYYCVESTIFGHPSYAIRLCNTRPYCTTCRY